MKVMLDPLIIRFFASFLIWFLIFGLFVLFFIDGKIKKEQVLHALFSALLAWLIALAIKYFFPTVRPYIISGAEAGVLIPPVNPSFPSEHTVIAFAVSLTIFMHDKKVGLMFMISSLFIGIARVIAQVHYPIDILGGAVVGSMAAVIVEKTHFLNLANYLHSGKVRRANKKL
jgi:undecaprenyl-diphosphatase